MNHHSSPASAIAEISVIGSGITVTGNIEASVDLHILGKIVGDVRCATLLLGPSGEVKGDIFAEAARISGTVQGRLETRDLAVESSARITGDIAYSRIRISNGGIVDGRCTHRPSEAAEAVSILLDAVDERPKRAAAQIVYIE